MYGIRKFINHIHNTLFLFGSTNIYVSKYNYMVYGNNVYIYGTHCYKKVTHDSITNGIRNNYYEYIELPEGKITIINGDLKTLVITDNSICCTCHDQHNNYDLQYSTSSKSWLIF